MDTTLEHLESTLHGGLDFRYRLLGYFRLDEDDPVSFPNSYELAVWYHLEFAGHNGRGYHIPGWISNFQRWYLLIRCCQNGFQERSLQFATTDWYSWCSEHGRSELKLEFRFLWFAHLINDPILAMYDHL